MKGPLKLSKDAWATFLPADRVADSVPGWKGNSKVRSEERQFRPRKEKSASENSNRTIGHGWVFQRNRKIWEIQIL